MTDEHLFLENDTMESLRFISVVNLSLAAASIVNKGRMDITYNLATSRKNFLRVS